MGWNRIENLLIFPNVAMLSLVVNILYVVTYFVQIHPKGQGMWNICAYRKYTDIFSLSPKVEIGTQLLVMRALI